MDEVGMITVTVIMEENEERTEATARVTVRDRQFTGWGRARRHPSDPQVPAVGEELAMARALSHLSHRLVDAAAETIEAYEGHPVHLVT
jgi:hypothetical protein